MGPEIAARAKLEAAFINRYTSKLSKLDNLGSFPVARCNNVENLVDTGMGVLVISAPLEQRSGSSSSPGRCARVGGGR
jgi:hypothetical protein